MTVPIAAARSPTRLRGWSFGSSAPFGTLSLPRPVTWRPARRSGNMRSSSIGLVAVLLLAAAIAAFLLAPGSGRI